MIEVITADVVAGLSRTSLNLPEASVKLDEPYIAAALRRLAGFLLPGSPRVLLRSMVESHRGLVDDIGTFAERVEEVIDTLVAIGDLLEVGDITLEGEKVRSTNFRQRSRKPSG